MKTINKLLVPLIVISMQYSEICSAQNHRKSGLSQLEFDHSKNAKPSAEPEKSLSPSEAILKIMNNQKQIEAINKEKKDLPNQETSPSQAPKVSKPKLGQLD